MSTSEPFLPVGDPRDAEADEALRERDLAGDPQDDTASDVDDEAAVAAVDDPDADRAAGEQRMHAESTPFRRPEPGERLSADELAADLGDDAGDSA
ncbi:hypothetical protein ITJ64_08535 [Herbiconiux sp. VKM Ac-1786]|uniref:hypothetical protein n=1 Tax=Herbiconiux sp. VKM Ac-1786 TaxID=2783824 RepID=UPI00188AEF11|nr:hypothetical protein [Herbiconiux sp. VKM Ac-1786]MBF4572563.1 hypothetical protein [Herbiconiux sp. VKM Ac-1786]